MTSHKERRRNIFGSLLKRKKLENVSWSGIYLFFCISIGLYVFCEWVFTVTKPSSYFSLHFFEKFRILLFTNSSITILFSIIVSVFFLFSMINEKHSVHYKKIVLLFPSFIITAFFLIQIDNFTYTLFGFGISTSGHLRFIYIFFLIFLFSYFLLRFSPGFVELLSLLDKRIHFRFSVLTIFFLNMVVLILTFIPNNSKPFLPEYQNKAQKSNFPNIIFITVDGLDASHMSTYGYDRETTPNISTLASHSLFAENAFTNSAKTTGAIMSLYTGRYPTSTSVLTPPDILKNQDAYLHLPGMLNSLGYYTVQFTYPYYADAFDENLREGFDYANGRSYDDNSFFGFLFKSVQTDEAHFIYELLMRLSNRINHIFYIKDMDDLQSLAQGKSQNFNDQEKLHLTIEMIEQTRAPIFLHLHWLGTHGPYFEPNSRVFTTSKEKVSTTEWDVDYYDDSIIDFDEGVGYLLDQLSKKDELNNTIILISSDHGVNWNSLIKIPLIIHFPDNENTGIVSENVQTIDIAPTILDYLNIEIPSWMEGNSLLKPILERQILSFDVFSFQTEERSTDTFDFSPPFYQFGYMGIIYCDQAFRFDLKENRLFFGIIQNHTQKCDERLKLTSKKVLPLMIDHLKSKNFDTSKLKSLPTEYERLISENIFKD